MTHFPEFMLQYLLLNSFPVSNIHISLLILYRVQPYLYTLAVTLKDASGNLLDCESCLVGIRQVSKAPKQLLVNGHPIIIRGVNRHEHHPRLGKTNIESCMVKVTHTLLPLVFSLLAKLICNWS